MRKKGRETRNSGRCHSTVHKPYEILIMAVVNTLRKRRILRDDWFVNPTRYLIIRFVFEFSSLVLPIQYNFTIVSNRLIDRMEHLFQRREFFIRIVLLFFYFSKKKKGIRITVLISFLVQRYLRSTISESRPLQPRSLLFSKARE